MDQRAQNHDDRPERQDRPLSEISHLFLSDLREKQTNGAPRPKRIPPPSQQQQQPAPPPPAAPGPEVAAAPVVPSAPALPQRRQDSVDMSAEEFAEAFADDGFAEPTPGRRMPLVTAIVGAHLNGKQFDRVKEYARHLAGLKQRVGLIELDASEFRLMCFEPGVPFAHVPDPTAAECYDPRQMAEAIEELSWDVDRWLLLIPSPRAPEARPLLREVNHWVLLSTCDHDGVVASYRMLKGLAEMHRPDGPAPRLTLALFDSSGEAELLRVYNKMSGVCQQFLGWHLEPEPMVRKTFRVAEHLVLYCRPTRDKAQLANAPQWGIVANYLARTRAAIEKAAAAEAQSPAKESCEQAAAPAAPEPVSRELVGEMVIPTAAEPVATKAPEPAAAAEAPIMAVTEPPAPPAAVAPQVPAPMPMPIKGVSDVLDLFGSNATPETILGAVLGQNAATFVECPVRPPMCADVRLAVGRDGSVVLFAVAQQGLGDLQAIGQAYRWLVENRKLIGMAVPQFAIDPHQAPRLRLLVDESDVSAAALQPMLQTGHVTVQSYRRLRWGERTGLLLAAA